jgi:hypothetical protein
MRVVAFIVLTGMIGAAIGLALQRVVVGVLVTAGILLLGLLMLVTRADSPGAEPYDSRRE